MVTIKACACSSFNLTKDLISEQIIDKEGDLYVEKNSKTFAIALCMTTMVGLYAATPAWAANIEQVNGTARDIVDATGNGVVNIAVGQGTTGGVGAIHKAFVSIDSDGVTIYGERANVGDPLGASTNIKAGAITTGSINADSLTVGSVNVGTTIGALQTAVGTNTANITANADAITVLNGADTLAGSVAYAVKAEADRAKAAEQANADKISDNKTAIATNATNISNHATDINTLKTNVGDKMYSSTEYVQTGDSLTVAVGKLDAQAKVNADAIAQEVLDREADVNAEENRAKAAEQANAGAIADNKDDIGDVNFSTTNNITVKDPLTADLSTAVRDLDDAVGYVASFVDPSYEGNAKGALDVVGAIQKIDAQTDGITRNGYETTIEGKVKVKNNGDISGVNNINANTGTIGSVNISTNVIENASASDGLVVEGVTIQDGAITTNGQIEGGSLTDGKATLSGGTLTVAGKYEINADGSASLAGGKFTVAKDSGDTNVGGTLGVTGEATFEENVTMKKDLQVGGDSNVDGTATFGASGNQTIIQDQSINATTGALSVEGVSVEDGTLAVAGKYEINKDGSASLASGKFTVAKDSGNTNVGGTLDVAQDATFKMNTQTDGTATFGTDSDKQTVISHDADGSKIVVNEGSNLGRVQIDKDGIKVGKNSTYIHGNGIDIKDGTELRTQLTKDDVSIVNPKPGGDRIQLSDLGQIDDIDAELKARAEYTSTMNSSDQGTAVGAINAEAAIRREEIARVNDRLDKVGAMSAAIANLRTMGYDPAAPSEFAMSVGQYRDQTGMAVGFFHYPHKDFMLSLSVSGAGDEYMGGIGATWKFGHRSPERLAEIEKSKAAKAKLEKALAEKKAKEARENAAAAAQSARHAKMIK